jgi:hypothetical protein
MTTHDATTSQIHRGETQEQLVEEAAAFTRLASDNEQGCASWHIAMERRYQRLKAAVLLEEARRGNGETNVGNFAAKVVLEAMLDLADSFGVSKRDVMADLVARTACERRDAPGSGASA